ncbi:MAG: alpha/beta hydrolase-fold protein [Pseudomonadota bacterium]
MLETVEINPPGKSNGTVIWLHGLGADGHDFEAIVPGLRLPPTLNLRFVFPHAPVRPVTINGGMRMRAWFDILGFDRQATQDEAGIRQSSAEVEQLIAAELERGVAAEQILLAGFSQGGVIALFTALRYPARLAGIMALSTYLPVMDTLAGERHSANADTSIFVAHGQFDTTLPLPLGKELADTLGRWGYTVEWHEYPMAHAVNAKEIADIAAYLRRAYGAD